MRIVFISNAYKPTISGVVTSMQLFRQGLIQCGHEVIIIAPSYKNYEDTEPDIFRIPAIDLTQMIDVSLAIPRKNPIESLISQIQPDIIHAQHPVLLGPIGAAIAKDLGLPLIFTFHTRYQEYSQKYMPIAPEITSTLIQNSLSRFLDQCSHIIAPTPSIKTMVQSIYRFAGPVSIIPTPIDFRSYQDLNPDRIRKSWGLTQGEKVLLYMGRLSVEKNLDLLLTSFQQIVSERQDVRLVIVGKGPAKDHLVRVAERLGILQQVLFVGAYPHEEIPHIAAAATLFTFPSNIETQGLVLVEALAAGTPVIAVRAPSTEDVLSSGGGVIVDPDPDLFARAVLQLLERPGSLAGLRLQAKKIANQYDMLPATQDLLAAYQQSLQENTPNRRIL
jgi:1,2-diacylglycerol 3-alpha-glucosyltransferase